MVSAWHRSLVLAVAAFLPALGCGMEIVWTRLAGQWPVEATPRVGNFSGQSKDEILVLNRGGQLLLWTGAGKAIGKGQDGLVARLPPGQWTTAPTLLDRASGARFVVASVEGQVVGLDAKFQPVWHRKLPGQTLWGRAAPVIVRAESGSALVFTDLTGTATCLGPDGAVVWTNQFGAGPGMAPPQRLSVKPGEPSAPSVLLPAGSTLLNCDGSGRVRWRRDLDKEIVTRPEVLALADRQLILCGTASGALFALSLSGDIVWQCATGDSFSHWLVLLPRRQGGPLILFTGLWGNLHAVDAHGRGVWTHLFRAKTRAAPLALEAGEDGHAEIFVPTFHQHILAFDREGTLKDDLRLSGIMPSALALIGETTAGPPDLLVATTTLLAYRLRPGLPRSPYGATPEPREVRVQFPAAMDGSELPAPRIDNPHGALIQVQLSLTDTQGWPRMVGRLTSRSAFEVPLPALPTAGERSLQATVSDVTGRVLQQATWNRPRSLPPPVPAPPADALQAWATAPYGAFSDTRLVPSAEETAAGETDRILVESLYLDEADQAAFIVASTRPESTRARVVLSPLARADGLVFGGSVVLREVVLTGSVNGERVPDALPALGPAGLLTIPSGRAAKIWLSVDARGAQPGSYTGRVRVSVVSFTAELKPLELPVNLEVLSLRLPKTFPLTVCTWDYVPNRWFSSRLEETLDDMSRHGVNVFPRSTLPAARVDAAGELKMDWTVLDAELDRLNQRGQILFHLHHPPLALAVPKTPEEKRPHELQYLRALRDHLRARGWDYADYAFYLLDEPGLDYGPNVAILIEAGNLVREADPKLRTYTDPVPGLSWQDLERIEPLVDLWAPNMRLVAGLLSGDPRIQRILRQKTVWSYECVSQVKSLSPLRYNRAHAWRAKFFGLSGMGFWTHSTTEADLWLPGKGINDEYALVYPGERPVPSVRWEAVRDGLEDVAAMVLLEEQIRRHRQAGTRSELAQKAEETLRIAQRDVMELSDETFVESRDFLRAGDRILGHTGTDLAIFRRHRAAIAALTVALGGE